MKKWISCETDEAIFVWHHADCPEPTWQMPSVREVANGEWIYYGRNEFMINCHIQEIPENAADVPHLNAVHVKNLFAGNDLANLDSPWTAFAVHGWDAK